MNISTLAKILGISINDLREAGQKIGVYGFNGRNTRIPYQSAIEVTKSLRPEKLAKLKNDDKIYLPYTIKVSDFAETIGRPVGNVVKTLLMNGVMATLNEQIDYDTASLIANELGVEVFPENSEDFASEETNGQLIKVFDTGKPESEKKYKSRPPVITIMGHVDHGKTSLLDYIRKSSVVSGEAGSITQHISSYQINFQNHKITFVDTPGHAAFTAMRARGTQLADFVILVVSSIEGPKPQTVEVIERAKMAKTPIIVALNKIDLPESDVERVKNEISQFGLVPEEWGGQTPFIPISAKTGQDVDKLLESIILQSEVAELKGEIECPAQAVIVESHLDRSLGVVSSVLVIKGEIKVGDIVRAGEFVGKIRKLETSEGKMVKNANLSEPVVLIGLPEIVEIGEPIIVYDNLKQAQTDASMEKQKRSKRKISYNSKNVGSGDNQINIILKADVSGSLEALKEALIKIPQEHAKIVVKSESVGAITESDVEFAVTTKSFIIAFHTQTNPQVEKMIQKEGVNLVQSDIIYEILEWAEEEILKHAKHEIKITLVGKAKVLATFKSDKPSIQVFGGEVIDGKILDNKVLFLIRNKENLGRLEIVQLQRNKDKVSEVNISQQFGVSVTGKVKVQVGDEIECVDERIVS
jgi:translation initiation factor IF-2